MWVNCYSGINLDGSFPPEQVAVFAVGVNSQSVQGGLDVTLDPMRAGDNQWIFAGGLAQRHEQFRNTRNVITVEMRYIDPLMKAKTHFGLHELQLSPLSAVEEQ